MAEQIINGAPLHISRGTQDRSSRPPVREAEAIPSHLPKFYVYAEKGPLTPQLVVGDSRFTTFGARTWDLRDKFANHATVFANAANAEGNQCMIERIVPADAGPLANCFISVDVMTHADGTKSIVFHTEYATTTAVLNTKFRKRTMGVSEWTEGTPGNLITAVRYPFMDIKASSIGEIFNNSGVRLFSRNEKSTAFIDRSIIDGLGQYPMNAMIVRRNTKTTTTTAIDNNFGERVVNFTLKEDQTHPRDSNYSLDLEKLIPGMYQNVDDPRFPPKESDVGSSHLYYDFIKTLLTDLAAAEIAVIADPLATQPTTTDFTATDVAADACYKFNLLDLVSSYGDSYAAVSFPATGSMPVATTGDFIIPSEYQDILMSGSSDGTMSDYKFAMAVEQKMEEYLNRDSFLMDTAVNVESVIYDSGFPDSTKKALCNFIAVRKDTAVMLSTYSTIVVVPNVLDPANPIVTPSPALSASADSSYIVSLRAFVEAFPESDYFGTPVMRGVVMGRSATIRNSLWKNETSALYSVLRANARYMGASDGRWIPGRGVDGAPNSIVTDMYKFSATFTPASVRIKDWDNGLNWIQAFDRSSFFIPALQTVYSDDTSVLNNMYTMFAICEINKVQQRAWRQFSGVGNMTNGQLSKAVDDFISERAHPNRFDNRFIIEPHTYFTDADIARGYSWTTPVNIYANPTRTVMVSSVHAYRMSDYAATAGA